MPRSLKVESHKFFAVVGMLFSYLFWLLIYNRFETSNSISESHITVASWIGIFLVVFFVLVWKNLTGKIFTPFNIFLAFFAVFNFGQCFLWAFGIHTDQEIGKKLVYHSIAADNNLIFRAQLLFLMCFITVNCGALLIWSRKQTVDIQPLRDNASVQADRRFRYLYVTALLLSIVVFPVTLLSTFQRFSLARVYGYHSLYYGVASGFLNNTIVNILGTLFFPCMLGLLIGSQYNKRVRFVVYSVFIVYAVLMLLCGDRGEWINLLAFLAWAEYSYYKKYKNKTVIAVAIIGFFSLSVMNAIVSLRNVGLSWDTFVSELTAAENNVVVDLLTEFGKSMGICIILLKTKVQYPYGNSFFLSVPTMFSTGLYNGIFDAEVVQLNTWFPDYLGLNYGTDFSIIGEAVLNYGAYVAPVVLLVEGIIIGKIFSR